MSIYLPYFYLIKHKSCGKLYAGSRTPPKSKLANPAEFMKPSGYQTSSKIIKEIIKNEGLDAIEILDIVTIEDLRIPFGISDIHQYETWFLKQNNVRQNENFLNGHENQLLVFGSIEYETWSMKTHGIPNFNNREKASKTCLQLYGHDHQSKVPKIKEQKKRHFMSKYGVENPFQSTEVKEKIQKTLLEKTGFKSPMENPETRAKSEKQCIDKYGVPHIGKIEITCPHRGKSGKSGGMKAFHIPKCNAKNG